MRMDGKMQTMAKMQMTSPIMTNNDWSKESNETTRNFDTIVETLFEEIVEIPAQKSLINAKLNTNQQTNIRVEQQRWRQWWQQQQQQQ